MTALLALLHYVALTASITTAMANIQPATNHDALAAQIASVAIWHPLFDDDDGTLTAAVLVATAAQESSFRPGAVGDHGRAFGLCQVWRRSDLMDPTANLIEAARQLRVSFAMCPRSMYSPYLSGKCTTDCRVRRLSAHREALAASVLRDMTAPDLSAAVSVRP